MVKFSVCVFFLTGLLLLINTAFAEQSGSIRGMAYDSDFHAPLASAQVLIAETGQTVVTSEEGNYVFGQVEPGTYTLVFSKEGYTRQVKADVVVSSGQMTEVDVSLSGEFEEMEEFVVQDVQIGTGTEAALLDLRMESPALMDSISADLMSRAGAGDAAAALNLVSGATVQDGKYATIRGLPDRYVNSQMNGVRLPTADADKRAVQLDQFPSAVIESVQVTKTFTPDQQGDASGGAVNVVLKGIPEETTLKVSTQYSTNTNVRKAGGDFLSYRGGGVNTWARDDGGRDTQTPGQSWSGAVGVSPDDPSADYKWSVSGGGKWDLEDFRIGGFGSLFYERKNSYFDDGVDDKYWVDGDPGSPMTPVYSQGAPAGVEEPFYTSLFDVRQGSQQVQWGGLGVFGIETENHSLSFLYMYTRDAEDKATIAENTRGKASLHQYWPVTFGSEFENYSPYDMTHPANTSDYRGSSPYLRFHTLEYTERTTQTFQINGRHTLPDLNLGMDKLFAFSNPELDWRLSRNSATLYQPDKRLFTEVWMPLSSDSGLYTQYKSAENFTLGNLQRIWKDIQEDSDQYSINLKLPFEQWSGDEGYLKFGLFNDQVTREYDQDSYSNFSDYGYYLGPWESDWSIVFPDENHPITAADIDVDYTGKQKISAWYYMMDLPFSSNFKFIGGARYENTDLSIINHPEEDVFWYPTTSGAVKLNPGDADVSFKQNDVLPSLGFEFSPLETVTFRGSYTGTIARQTFKELTPIQQQEYVGADLFIGNPDLRMSALNNYDLRFDWTPYKGGLFSLSYFYKDVKDPIEYRQKRGSGFTFTTPENYPEGQLSGFEVEMRQQLGHFWTNAEGISIGANATFIDSVVTLPDEEAQALEDLGFPQPKRDMTNTPEHLYNFFLTYDLEKYGTQFSLFYTVRGDTLIAGAGETGEQLIPSVYETEYGTLNFGLSQKLGEIWTLKFQAKNLLDPEIQTVSRDHFSGEERTKTSYTKGMDFSISLSATF